jgi:hypothetical protein
LLDCALVDHRNAAGHRERFILIVSDDDESNSNRLLKAGQFHAHVIAQLCVQCRQRFIKQQNLGPLHEGSRQGHALALAAGHLIGLTFGEVGELYHLQGFCRSACGFIGWNTRYTQAIGDVVFHCHVGEHGVGLKHHVCRALVRWRQRHVLAPYNDLALGWRFQA